ncbi:MAG: spore cortex biosynthesis protein YabQ [Acutalibacteraceae bacterium]
MVKALWAFFLLGVALFFFYDVLRFWRSVWGSRRATFLADVLWWLVAAFSCYTLFLAYTDGVIRALCLVVCGGGFACGYFTLGTLTGHLWARLGKRLAGKRNNRRKKTENPARKSKKNYCNPHIVYYIIN